MYIKSPINWVGNKYKYLHSVNELVSNKEYDSVHELFLGTGNILINLECKSNEFIGYDKTKLVPMLYSEIKKYNYDITDIEITLDKFNRFSSKEDYYNFRDYWNQKYLNNHFDKEFIIETVLLLKMCSNSMVRFNPKEGYFNQGFRGLGDKKEFFTETMKEIIIVGLNNLKEKLSNSNYEFKISNFDKFIDAGENNLLILDPPYILRKDMYDTDFTEEMDNKILELIKNTKNDFIYFNYLNRDGVDHKLLLDVIDEKKFNLIPINNKTLSGQGRKNGKTYNVNEVIVTNIK